MTLDRVGFIGDVHGRLDLLEGVVRQARTRTKHLVFLGDYVNRGPQSREVINLLIELVGDPDLQVTLLAGHHDDLFLTAIRSGRINAFLRVGGAATVAAYVSKPIYDVAAQLLEAVPLAHVKFLESLERYALNDEYVAAHDARNPEVRALARSRYVVSGHTPQTTLVPSITAASALIDTGAGTLVNGRLTCLLWPSREWLQAV